MKECAPEPGKRQALAVVRSRDEDGSYHIESQKNLSTFDLPASANIVFLFCSDQAVRKSVIWL